MKENLEIYAEKLTVIFNNEIIIKSNFPDILKDAEVTPAFKNKGDSTDKNNYRPISCLSPMSKVFERLLYNRLCVFF